MQDQHVSFPEEDSDRPLVPRALPSARFVQDLDLEIRRAARRKMEKSGIRPRVPFEEMVIELRKLVRLLRKTLVPVQPRAEFTRALGQRIEAQAVTVVSTQHQHRRWLMLGGLVGSLLSLAGLLAALLLRKRNGHGSDRVRARHPMPAA
jgi:hypothetical protein